MLQACPFRILQVLSIALLYLGFPCGGWGAPNDQARGNVLDQVIERASREKKHVLLQIYNDGVVESRMVRSRCLKDPAVRAAINQGFLECVIEFGQVPELELMYSVKQFPTIVILGTDGTEEDRFVGGFFAKTLSNALNAVLAGKSELNKLKDAAADSRAGIAAHMALADGLSRRGAKAEALSEYLWCLRQGPSVDPKSFHASLDSILLRIDGLASRMPEAAAVLQDERAHIENSIKFDDADSVKIAFEFNDVLQAYDQNLKLYDRLPAKSALRRKHFGSVFTELVKQRRYVDASSVLDLESYVNAAYPLAFDDDIPGDPDIDEKGKQMHDVMLEKRRQRVGTLTAAAVEALLGVDKLEKAKRLASRALEEQMSRDLKLNLVHAANRSEKPCASEFLTWLEKQVTLAAKPGS